MQPEIPMKQPVAMDLDAGTYYWCACGKSSNQPFCDGSHKGTEFVPLKFEIEDTKKVWLCGCKQTKNPPYCDGTHKKL
jgi:CDGSH-type Zn-finger protein